MKKTDAQQKRATEAEAQLPKNMLWVKHVEGRNFGKLFLEMAVIAKSSGLNEELRKTDPPDDAIGKLMDMSMTMTIMDLKAHGALQNSVDRTRNNAPGIPNSAAKDKWRKVVSLLLSTQSPLISNMLAAYGEHIESVAAKQEYENRKTETQRNSYQTAFDLIAKANRSSRQLRITRDSAYRLVNALNGCWLAHYCGIDQRYAVINLINSVLDSSQGGQSLSRAVSAGFGRYMTKPFVYKRFAPEDRTHTELEICAALNTGTAEMLDGLIEDCY